ncbi:response regulator transcription factor [Scatolibacter rhodanostii]|uniref:response regulator transcription factor n=1 Tax=Scatolibacter rhodanostii TaxID=2014781 RepID=UPI000C084304|nr:response regulator [Scatolibacter rhodanostii]
MYQVLIVDDDKLARKGLISIVPWKECGLQVAGDVSNGVIALDFIANNKVDMVVVDLSMPALSGLDFIKESKKRYPNLNYVVLSFHEGFEYVQSALRLGALDYISKLRLEQEDCTEVFFRAKALLDRAHQEDMGQEETTSNEAVVDSICEKIEQLYWVYHKDVFEEIMDTIQREHITGKPLYRIMIKMLNIIKNTFSIVLDEHYYEKTGNEVEAIRKINRDLYEQVGQMQDNTRLEILILKSIIYIHQHLVSHHLKSEKIADAVNISRGYFSISFKKFTGYTVSNYIRKERVNLAKKIMKTEKMSVSELAYRVGYKDEKYFSRIFYEQEGVSCSEFRKQMT